MDFVRLLTPEQLASTPAGIPPPGVVSNFVDPPTIGYYIIGALAPLMTIMWVLAALKFYTATFVRKKFLADDWTAALSVVWAPGVFHRKSAPADRDAHRSEASSTTLS